MSMHCNFDSLAVSAKRGCNRRRLLAAILAFALSACAAPPAPKDVFYRFSPPTPASLPSEGPVAVRSLGAEGIYNERTLLYSDDADHQSVSQFSYRFWVKSPPRLMQDYLIDWLRAAAPDAAVVEYEGGGEESLIIGGQIRGFEIEQDQDRWRAVVALDLQAQKGFSRRPLLVKSYRRAIVTPLDDYLAAIKGFQRATDEILGAFSKDLAAARAGATQ